MTLSLTLPDTAGLGDAGHVGDHNLISAALQDVEDAINAASGGLTLITAQAFTAASAVNVNNCFTSTYADYLVSFTLTAASANGVVNCRMRASAADNSTTNYQEQTVAAYTSTVFTGLAGGGTSWAPFSMNATYPRAVGSFHMSQPQLAAETLVYSDVAFFASSGLSNTYQRNANGMYFTATTQFDGLSLYPASGTITGTIRVYGYQKI